MAASDAVPVVATAVTPLLAASTAGAPLVKVLGVAVAVPPPPPPPVPAAVEAARAQIDWASAGEEAVEVLRQYLMVPTINPPGDETLGVDE